MTIGWLAVLKTVPWVDVISRAPQIADGATKLWHSVGKKKPFQRADSTDTQAEHSLEAETSARLREMATLRAAVSDLQNQMLASSELINALAEQNAQLIKHAETSRSNMLRLAVGTMVLACVVVLNLVMIISR